MCATPPEPDARGAGLPDAGFSLLEMLIVLGVMALAVGIVMPRGALMLDRATAHSVFFDFQRQASDLRLKAYRTETPALLADAGQPGAQQIVLRSGWSYRLDRPVAITDGGACSQAEARLLKGGREVMRLRTGDGRCHFIRLE
jgi:prepilin-type N-terminal cleavage/methylation domain-containing protein